MKFDLDFSGIYVFDIPIDWILILLFIRVEVNIYGANEKGKRELINMKCHNL